MNLESQVAPLAFERAVDEAVKALVLARYPDATPEQIERVRTALNAYVDRAVTGQTQRLLSSGKP